PHRGQAHNDAEQDAERRADHPAAADADERYREMAPEIAAEGELPQRVDDGDRGRQEHRIDPTEGDRRLPNGEDRGKRDPGIKRLRHIEEAAATEGDFAADRVALGFDSQFVGSYLTHGPPLDRPQRPRRGSETINDRPARPIARAPLFLCARAGESGLRALL